MPLQQNLSEADKNKATVSQIILGALLPAAFLGRLTVLLGAQETAATGIGSRALTGSVETAFNAGGTYGVAGQAAISAGLWGALINTLFPIHQPAGEDSRLTNPLIETPGANPASGGYAAGGLISIPNSTGGSEIADQTPFDYSRPWEVLPAPGVMEQGAKEAASEGLEATKTGKITIDGKIGGQLEARGWTQQGVQDVIDEGPVGTTADNRSASKTPDGLARSDPASVYGSKNGYVVVNDRTGEVVQISGKNDPGWIPDSRIKWK